MPTGSLYVGDRSGTIFRVRDGTADAVRDAPPSVAAFHLAMSPSGELFVSAPTLASYDHVYRIDRDGGVRTLLRRSAGRRAGVLPDEGVLHVVDALAGGSGLYRLPDLDGEPELVVSARGAGRRRVRPRRRARRDVERNRLPASTWSNSRPHVAALRPQAHRRSAADRRWRSSLKRVLGAGDLVMLAIGAVIGAGIFSRSAPRPPAKCGRTARSSAAAPARR